jgi:hypothetical protein
VKKKVEVSRARVNANIERMVTETNPPMHKLITGTEGRIEWYS